MKTWTSVCSDDAVPGHSWIKVDPVSSNSSWDFWKCGLTWDSSILPSDNRTSYGKMDPSADSLPIMILLCNYNEHAEHVILSMANVLDWRATWRHRVLPSVRIPGPASAASMECQGLTGAWITQGMDGLLGVAGIINAWYGSFLHSLRLAPVSTWVNGLVEGKIPCNMGMGHIQWENPCFPVSIFPWKPIHWWRQKSWIEWDTSPDHGGENCWRDIAGSMVWCFWLVSWQHCETITDWIMLIFAVIFRWHIIHRFVKDVDGVCKNGMEFDFWAQSVIQMWARHSQIRSSNTNLPFISLCTWSV